MDEQRFRALADQTFRTLLDAFDEVDVDQADAESTGDVITVTFRDGSRCVINTQAAAKQIWLAGGQSGWHFDYDEATGKWMHDKGTGDELFATVARLAKESAGLDLQFPAR